MASRRVRSSPSPRQYHTTHTPSLPHSPTHSTHPPHHSPHHPPPTKPPAHHQHTTNPPSTPIESPALSRQPLVRVCSRVLLLSETSGWPGYCVFISMRHAEHTPTPTPSDPRTPERQSLESALLHVLVRGGKVEGEEAAVESEPFVVSVPLSHVSHATAVRLWTPRDMAPLEARASVGLSLDETIALFEGRLPPLDPIEHMGTHDAVLACPSPHHSFSLSSPSSLLITPSLIPLLLSSPHQLFFSFPSSFPSSPTLLLIALLIPSPRHPFFSLFSSSPLLITPSSRYSPHPLSSPPFFSSPSSSPLIYTSSPQSPGHPLSSPPLLLVILFILSPHHSFSFPSSTLLFPS